MRNITCDGRKYRIRPESTSSSLKSQQRFLRKVTITTNTYCTKLCAPHCAQLSKHLFFFLLLKTIQRHCCSHLRLRVSDLLNRLQLVRDGAKVTDCLDFHGLPLIPLFSSPQSPRSLNMQQTLHVIFESLIWNRHCARYW